MAAIEVSGLTKEYGDVVANDGLSFEVEAGEVFGYLGPNGAGKTTTIRMLLGLQSPTGGTARLLGADVENEAGLVAAKRRVGYLPADPAFEGSHTGREILDLHAAVKGDRRRDELLSTFDPPLDRRVRAYSSGNRQMLGIVVAFMHDPDVVVLDEPTSGLDPLKQSAFNEFVRAEQAAGTTVFMSSHVLGEVRRVCDRVGIIREGTLVTTERVEDLLRRSGKVVRLAVAGDPPDLDIEGVHDPAVRTAEAEGAGEGRVTEASFTYTGDVNALLDCLAGLDVLELDVEEAPIEDVFMRFYGEDGEGTLAGTAADGDGDDDPAAGGGRPADDETGATEAGTGTSGADAGAEDPWEWVGEDRDV